MTWQEWLNARPIAVLSTVGADGMPHAVPIEVVVDGDKVYSWGQATAARMANIERSGSAAVVAYRGHSFVLVRGSARLVKGGDPIYPAITQRFLDKYERQETYGNDTLVEVRADRVVATRID